MSEPTVMIGNDHYRIVTGADGPKLEKLLFKSNSLGPTKPVTMYGSLYIVFRDSVVMGWREASTAWQALEASFGHPHNPLYSVTLWDHCKYSVQQEALDEGRIDGKIWEGCPDCQALIKQLNEQIVKLTDELAAYKSIEIVTLAPVETPHAR